MSDPVRLLFFGGLGEIGRNCFCLEIDKRLLVIDCGLMFPTADMPGVDLVLPDLSYLVARANDIEAIVLTHGHEDHVGALPYLLAHVSAPIYGSELTLGLLRPKLEEHHVAAGVELVAFSDRSHITVGPFSFEPIAVTHSVPHGVGFAFYTPQGTICHTGDFKLDQTPVDGRLTDITAFGALGEEGVRLLLSDSTNSEAAGMTKSETLVGEWMGDLFRRHAKKRVIAACFSTHLHRVQQICDAAVAAERRIAFLGRSMLNNTELARELDVLQLDANHLIDITEVGKLPPAQVCVICTGAQGEPLAALSLMSSGDHRHVKIGPDDTVIISATVIPGNESNVHRAIDGLLRHGADVVHSGVADVHVSGHAASEELKFMLSLTDPDHFVPVHGEYRHLVTHAKLASAVGIPDDCISICLDGDVIEVTDNAITVSEGQVPAGYVYVDGAGVGDITKSVLRDRRDLAEDGVLVCVVGVDSRSGDVVRGPEILSRGFLSGDDLEKFASEAAERVLASIEQAANENALDLTTLNRHVRQTLKRFAKERIDRRPIVFPLVVEV